MKTRLYAIMLVLAGLAAAGLAVLSIASPQDGEEAGAAATRVGFPFGIYSPGSLDEVPGERGLAMIAAAGLDSIEEYEDYSIGLVNEIGATWVRADFPYEAGAFREQPALIGKYFDNGFDVVGCIRPTAPSDLNDLAGFESELRQLIQSYSWISVWQIGNEGNLGWGSPEDYARFFVSGQRVVREECPDCRVALAGVETLRPGPREARDSYDRIIASIISSPTGGARPFDIFDFHYYGYYGAERELLEILGGFRDILDAHGLEGVSIWMTESATSTGQPTWPLGAPAQTEAEQASELVTRFVSMLGAGVERVSWARPYENCRYAGIEGGYFDNTGLVYNGLGLESDRGIRGGTKKEAFYAYQTLVSRLGGYYKVRVLAPDQYEFSFRDGRDPVYIVWGAPGAGLASEMSGLLTVTSLDGEQTDLDAADFSPGPEPVFVERR